MILKFQGDSWIQADKYKNHLKILFLKSNLLYYSTFIPYLSTPSVATDGVNPLKAYEGLPFGDSVFYFIIHYFITHIYVKIK
jgi:hypothetical protein